MPSFRSRYHILIVHYFIYVVKALVTEPTGEQDGRLGVTNIWGKCVFYSVLSTKSRPLKFPCSSERCEDGSEGDRDRENNNLTVDGDGFYL